MGSQAQHGYILLADISGFDAYMTQAELDHASSVMADILSRLTERLVPPLHLSNLAGGALLVYMPEEELPRGETLLELIETTYASFRDTLRDIHRNTTCACKACLAIPTLDLKFLVHYGEYLIHHLAGSPELVGAAAQLIRDRVLKDQFNRNGEHRAYALFTSNSLERLGIQPDLMVESSKTYPDYGEVRAARLDLQPRYQAMLAARQMFISAEDADVIHTVDIAASPSYLWDWLNDPIKRNVWMEGRIWKAGLRIDGRTGIGTRNHCAHGAD